MNKKFYLIFFSGLLVLFLSIGALLSARANPKENAYGYLTIFSNVIHLVDANYVDSVDFNKVIDSALYGMVENLDPDSFFIKGKELESYKKSIEENKIRAGVGLSLAKRFGMVMVIAVDKGSPAEKVKIRPGDYIRSVGDQYVQTMPLYKIYTMIKGAPGTEVKISIFRSALEKPEEFVLERASTAEPYIEGYIIQPKIGYIRVGHLLPGVETEIQNKLEFFNEQAVNSMILDVRNCTEEVRDIAVRVADLFVGAVPIVQIAGREGEPQKITGDSKILFKGSLLVLVDHTTSGGAELLAGAIQDSGAGKAFGGRTFGRGGIQKLIPAGDNWVMLTTQKYLTPKGKMILNNGIEPAIPFKEDVKSIDPQEDVDRMLDKAIEYLRAPVEQAA